MNYQETVEYLFTRLPMFSRVGAAAYREDLHNTLRLCTFLDNPERKFKSVHVAGTNGKGSVSHMLAAVFQTAGYKTGLYTSPHLKDFRERIKVDGHMISSDFVVAFTEKIKPMIDELDPSFFEITVAMAFDYFAASKVDIAIIETGLGGRLDSTNVIVPELSVITNIGMDHMNILGGTLEAIAGEKAGIIKRQVPVVIGEYLPQTLPVFRQKADQEQAVLSLASRKRHALDWKWEKHELIVNVALNDKTDHQNWQLDLPGVYQVKNLLTVLEACDQLRQRGWKLDDSTMHKALRQVKKLTGLHGRWEVIHQSPQVVLDVAHNEDGIRQMLEQLEVTEHDRTHIVLGMVKDKDIERVMSLLPRTAFYYFTQASIPRAIEAAMLQSKAASFGLRGKYFPNVNAALAEALVKAAKEDLILVCGSVFLVGEVSGIG